MKLVHWSWTQLFFYSLLLSSLNKAQGQENKSSSSNGSTSLRSICNPWGLFSNKDIVKNKMTPDEGIEGFRQTMNIRVQYLSSASNSETRINNELVLQQNSLFEGHKNFDSLKEYFKLIARTVETAKVRRHHANGYCGEATDASIVNSLLDQLQSNYRMSVQRVIIWSKTSKENHTFVLYNSKPLQSKAIEGNNELEEIFRSALPLDQRSLPVICDEFENYHGPSAQWYRKFFNDKDHKFSQLDYDRIEIISFSLPQFNQFNGSQRKYIRASLIALLEQVNMCDAQNNIANCLSYTNS